MGENSYWTYLVSSSFSGVCVVSLRLQGVGGPVVSVELMILSSWSACAPTVYHDAVSL